MLTGVLLAHPVFAHDFVQNSNADLIAKIQEFKVEANLIANNISNSTLSQWHISKSQDYFGSNEIGALSQKDSALAYNLSTSTNDLYILAGQPNAGPTVAFQKNLALANDSSTSTNNSYSLAGQLAGPTVVTQKASTLNQMMNQVESVEISNIDQNSATIQSLAIVDVLNEALKDYGYALGSTVDLTNMSNMNIGSMSGMQSGNNMQGMSGMSSTHVVNVAAYQSAQALTDTAQTMFNNLKSIAPSSPSHDLDKIGNALMNFKEAIDSKESANDAMMIVHTQIHPDFISGFNLQVVPEFPMPILLIMVSFIGIIVMSRVFPKIR
jgi:hypothetical protein